MDQPQGRIDRWANAYFAKLGCGPGGCLLLFVGFVVLMLLLAVMPDGWSAQCSIATGPLQTKCLVWKNRDKCLTWYGAEKPCPRDY